MRAMILFVVLVATGCAMSVERECAPEACAATELRCPETAELWHCEVPERGFENMFCDFGGGTETLEESCVRSCYNAGACEVPVYETAAVRTCRCPEPLP